MPPPVTTSVLPTYAPCALYNNDIVHRKKSDSHFVAACVKKAAASADA